MMEDYKVSITIIKKQFLLVGFEIAMDFNKGFMEEIKWIQSELKRSLDRIGSKTEPMRLVGFWQPWQAFTMTPDPVSASKAKYFFGVEVSNLDSISSDCVVKVAPESEYAVYREITRGTAPKAEMYAVSGHIPNYEIAGDFEIFDDFDHLGENDSCDVLVPIILKKEEQK
jgi:hypothetical protein